MYKTTSDIVGDISDKGHVEQGEDVDDGARQLGVEHVQGFLDVGNVLGWLVETLQIMNVRDKR